VRGLGHGQDDNALRAAKQIYFKPAVKDGQPADSTVLLHIIFQLTQFAALRMSVAGAENRGGGEEKQDCAAMF